MQLYRQSQAAIVAQVVPAADLLGKVQFSFLCIYQSRKRNLLCNLIFNQHASFWHLLENCRQITTVQQSYFIKYSTFLFCYQVNYDAIKIPKWPPFSEMHPVDYYSTYTKNCSGKFTQEEIRNIRAHYYAMCAETDAMLGR